VVEGFIAQKIRELQKHKSQLAASILSDKLSKKEAGLAPAPLQSLLKPLGQSPSEVILRKFPYNQSNFCRCCGVGC
jgi:hypothetical protein